MKQLFKTGNEGSENRLSIARIMEPGVWPKANSQLPHRTQELSSEHPSAIKAESRP